MMEVFVKAVLSIAVSPVDETRATRFNVVEAPLSDALRTPVYVTPACDNSKNWIALVLEATGNPVIVAVPVDDPLLVKAILTLNDTVKPTR
jgi:hypothetical protein